MILISLIVLILLKVSNAFNNTNQNLKYYIMNKVIIFSLGNHINHTRNIKSAIQHSFDNYRKSLTSTMTLLNENINYMNEYEQNDDSNNNDYIYRKLKSIHDQFRQQMSIVPSLWEENEKFLSFLLSTNNLHITYSITDKAAENTSIIESTTIFKRKTNNNNETSKNKISSYDTLENILLHLYRDWSNDNCMSHISVLLNKINEVSNLIEIDNKNDVKILVPGSGLGRIAVELAALGYSVEMNECSPQMSVAFNTIVNEILKNDSIEYYYYPFIHSTLNDQWDLSYRNQSMKFPPNGIEKLKEYAINGTNLISLQFGDFVSSYKIKERKNSFDIIVTSFFIDTGNLLEYLECILYILKHNGIWINLGPFHYHSAATVKYSYSQFLEITSLLGFELINQNQVEGPYGCDKKFNMKPDYYIVPLDVFRKTQLTSPSDVSSLSSDPKTNWNQQNFILI